MLDILNILLERLTLLFIAASTGRNSIAFLADLTFIVLFLPASTSRTHHLDFIFLMFPRNRSTPALSIWFRGANRTHPRYPDSITTFRLPYNLEAILPG